MSLQVPTPGDEEFTNTLTRAPVTNYCNESDRFKIPPEKRYGIQYSHMYYTRLNLMKPRLLNAAQKKWGQLVV